jgi:negative regulator of flagellin synthesis FlgM
MTDKINNVGRTPVELVGSTRRTTTPQTDAAQSGRTGAPAAQTGDQVSLTSSARLLQKVEAALRETPSVDAVRVEALKQAIESGEYQVDAETLADRLLKLDRDLS